MTLNLVGLKPRLYIEELYIPALNKSTRYNTTSLNTSIFMDLKFNRVLAMVALSYQDVNITIFYNSTGYFATIPKFDQGGKRTVRRKVVVEARTLPWEDVFEKVSGGSMVVFTVVVATRYRLERCDYEGDCSYTRPKTLIVEGDVWVDGFGEKVSSKPIRLH
ncbi:uncharacterized protein LOC125195606 [Salvia hispanica]|uniref:uncharacterized protein LOC125195606 n=1 Tax=Salvia hispanica TaxID=49212 RepID=UPI0020091EC5|nr:uncharacterized protein LOC125195606 [Salvia hispanica]